jgi:branched-chain amino acid transport system substrate-binding protein
MLALLGACQGSQDSTPVATTPSHLDCPVRIGLLTSQTGAFRTRAQESIQGYALARDHISANGGIGGCQDIELVIRDDKSDEDTAAKVFKQMIDEGLPVVLGPYAKSSTLRVAPLAAQNRIPLLAQDADGFLATSLGADWVFRPNAPAWDSVGFVISYTANLPLGEGNHTLGLVSENSAKGKTFSVAVASYAKQLGLAVVIEETYQPDISAADLRDLVKRVVASQPAVLFLTGEQPNNATELVNEFRAQNYAPQVWIGMGEGFDSAVFLGTSTSSNYFLNAQMWTNSLPRADTLSGLTTQQFVERYQREYKLLPTWRSANAFVSFYLVARAYEQVAQSAQVGTLTLAQWREQVRDHIRQTQFDQTLIGPILFNASGQNHQTLLLVQALNGQWQVVAPEPDRTTELVFPAPAWDER